MISIFFSNLFCVKTFVWRNCQMSWIGCIHKEWRSAPFSHHFSYFTSHIKITIFSKFIDASSASTLTSHNCTFHLKHFSSPFRQIIRPAFAHTTRCHFGVHDGIFFCWTQLEHCAKYWQQLSPLFQIGKC